MQFGQVRCGVFFGRAAAVEIFFFGQRWLSPPLEKNGTCAYAKRHPTGLHRMKNVTLNGQRDVTTQTARISYGTCKYKCTTNFFTNNASDFWDYLGLNPDHSSSPSWNYAPGTLVFDAQDAFDILPRQ